MQQKNIAVQEEIETMELEKRRMEVQQNAHGGEESHSARGQVRSSGAKMASQGPEPLRPCNAVTDNTTTRLKHAASEKGQLTSQTPLSFSPQKNLLGYLSVLKTLSARLDL